ncbi:hypothetical protein CFK37_19815 [Virgibacillus phasianinus]|uniref:Helix-turn-helix domain-containing protein n=1 Tax=Virgibacillus phasianinus TaxID=2017483 RepID=A0A220U928_9BACI|nr:helix-turn-helix domain-containing protein [Virgibacillus phasianinus]ASK64233.1 hypothetical protein CFK37_19815 [Virgibacillus phasianinus]
MSLAVFEETKKDIETAYKEKSKSKIEKETSYILSQLIMIMMGTFKDRVKSVSMDARTMDYNEEYIYSEDNYGALLEWLKQLMIMESPISNEEFGKLKVDFEDWYYRIGGQNIAFDYHDDYLLTTSEAAKKLNVSTVTINKYLNSGLEKMVTTSHRKIPKHAVQLWRNPEYCLKMQMNFQENKLRNQSAEERLKEVVEEILEFQLKYKVDKVEEAFPMINEDMMGQLQDYYEWDSLEEEYRELKQKVSEERLNAK